MSMFMGRHCVGTSKSISFESFDELHAQWLYLLRMSPKATLYHSEEWIKILRLTYGFCFRAAILECQGVAEAGLLLAGVRRPLAQWWLALPFSDGCPPLAVDGYAETVLLSQLQQFCSSDRFEIRGMPAPWRWQSADCFLSWELDLSKSPNQLYAMLENNFRRNLNKARKMGIGITHGNGPEMVERFYRLHAWSRRRLGLPCQPLRFFRIVKQVLENKVDVWLASRNGCDIGAIFLIGHGDTLFFKWSARNPNETSGAVHLLAWSLIEHWAGRFRRLDLGRTDVRNAGLNRFKHGLGGHSNPLPYAFFPAAPHNLSSEILSAKRRILADIWRRLPRTVCRGIEGFAYQYLA